MGVLVDTCIWSTALRRAAEHAELEQKVLAKLINYGQVVMIGPIRQEILAGIKVKSHFDKLRADLKNFSDVPLVSEDYEQAALNFNTCRSHGVQGSNTDFLICAVAIRLGISVLTSDEDFKLYKKYLKFELKAPKEFI